MTWQQVSPSHPTTTRAFSSTHSTPGAAQAPSVLPHGNLPHTGIQCHTPTSCPASGARGVPASPRSPSISLHGGCLILEVIWDTEAQPGPDTPTLVCCLHSVPGDPEVRLPSDIWKMRLAAGARCPGPLPGSSTRTAANPRGQLVPGIEGPRARLAEVRHQSWYCTEKPGFQCVILGRAFGMCLQIAQWERRLGEPRVWG